MKQNIRYGVFETNSSSSHSISVSEENNSMWYDLPTTAPDDLRGWAASEARVFGVEDEEIWEFLDKYLGVNEDEADNVLLLSGGGYGWGYDTLTSPKDKLNYLLTYITNTSDKDTFMEDERFKLLREIVMDFSGIRIAVNFMKNNEDFMHYEIPEDFYEAALRYFMDYDNLDGFYYSPEGEYSDKMTERILWNQDIYIDHQSLYLARDLFLNKEDLKNFIFNDKYSVIIDNDNH